MIRDPKHVLLAGAVVLASWLVSSATSPPAAELPAGQTARATTPSRDAALDSLARDVDREAMRLRERLAEAPPPNRSARNPFEFGAVPASRPRRDAAPPSLETTPMPAYTAPAASMPYKLIGIAETTSDAGIVERKAILSGSGDLVIVGADQSVGTRFLVVAIGADAVELFDAATSQPVRLTLR